MRPTRTNGVIHSRHDLIEISQENRTNDTRTEIKVELLSLDGNQVQMLTHEASTKTP